MKLIIGLLLALVVLSVFVPEGVIDPWGLFSPRKIGHLILAIALVQALGEFFILRFGAHAGAIAAGALGGLVSSTAVTLALARRSQLAKKAGPVGVEGLLYVCATGAMLFEGVLLLFLGNREAFARAVWVFLAPLALTLVRVVMRSRDIREQGMPKHFLPTEVSAAATLKLSLLIVAILTLSRLGQFFFGESGLFVLTFLVSLFEIHSSIVANLQLHSGGQVSTDALVGLFSVSIAASYVSKWFLVSLLGSRELAREVREWTAWMLLTILATWWIVG